MELGTILEGTVTGDKASIDNAEKFLNSAIQQNLPGFVVALSNELAEVTRSPAVRMAAGLRLKNLLTSKDDDTKAMHQQNWLQFPEDVRKHVKLKVLQSLGTETISPSSAAQCVAFIACIEVPRNLWGELIPALLRGVTVASSTEGLKEASLEAIGYMCEEIDPSVLEGASNDILTAIVQGMRKEEPSLRVRLAATKAFLNSLEFTKKNFGNDQERNFIMQVLCENTQCTDVRVRVAALQNLNQVMCLHYQYMETYMGQALFAITLQAMQSDDDDVALQGIEFWSTVAEEEIDLAIAAAEAAEEGHVPVIASKHYAKGALQFLVPILMLVLTHQDEFDDEDTWKPNKAASVCLMLMATCCEDDIVNHVVPFVKTNITSDDWKFREAALMAFSSILEGPNPDTLLPLIVDAIPVLLWRMDDPASVVKDTLAYCFGRICELHPDAIIDKPYTVDFFKGVLAGIDAEPTVAGNYCLAISSLAETAYDKAEVPESSEIPATYSLSPIFGLLITKLLAATCREDASSNHLRSSAYEAIMELVKNSPADCYAVVQQTMLVIIQRVQELIALESNVSQAERSQYNDMQSLLCATLQAVLRRVDKKDAADLGPTVFSSLISMLQTSSTGAVQEDVLMAVGSLIELLGENFLQYMSHLQPFLIVALNAVDQYDVCFAAIGIVSDLCRSVGKDALLVCPDDIMMALFRVLHKSVQRSIKPQVLSVLGDVALCLGQQFMSYCEPVLSALQAVFAELSNLQATPADRVDADDREYIPELRESLLEAYIGVVQSVLNGQENGDNIPPVQKALLEPHLGAMFGCVKLVASDLYRTDSNIAVACGLVGDLMKCYGCQLLPLVDQASLSSLLQEGRSSKVPKTRALAMWTSKEIRKLTL